MSQILLPPPSPRRPHNAAQDAAALLRRIGFAILVLAVPVAAMVSRRATVVLAPIGVVLMILATMIDEQGGGLFKSAYRVAQRFEFFAASVLIVWAFISLLWTPFVGLGSEKLLNIIGTAGMIFLGVAALPEKMRASNLYLMAIGTAIATIFALIMAISVAASSIETEGRNIQRGLVILAIFIWPSIGWLVSRGRRVEALMLVSLAFAGTLPGASHALTISLLCGGVVFGIILLHAQKTARIVAYASAATLILAPLIPFIFQLLFKLGVTPSERVNLAIRIWSDIITGDAVRLITGHGAEAALRSRLSGILPTQAPNSILFEIWYDYGVVGACGLAAVCFFLLIRLSEQKKGQATEQLAVQITGQVTKDHQQPHTALPHPMLPAKFACFVTAAMLSTLGIDELSLGNTQVWWLTSLGVVALAFVAIDRGQFRHRLPRAWMGTERRNG